MAINQPCKLWDRFHTGLYLGEDYCCTSSEFLAKIFQNPTEAITYWLTEKEDKPWLANACIYCLDGGVIDPNDPLTIKEYQQKLALV